MALKRACRREDIIKAYPTLIDFNFHYLKCITFINGSIIRACWRQRLAQIMQQENKTEDKDRKDGEQEED